MQKNRYEQEKQDLIQLWRCQKLFRAVLLLAAKDAYMIRDKTSKERRIKKDALKFFENIEELKFICELAYTDYRLILNISNNQKLKNKEKYNKIILNIMKNNMFFD